MHLVKSHFLHHHIYTLVRRIASKLRTTAAMFSKRTSLTMEQEPSSYAAVHAKFTQYHQLSGNCNTHMFTLLLGLLGIAGLIIRGCVSLSKDKPRASLARAITVSVWLAYDIILFATDVPNILATKCTCILFFVAILSLRLDLGWIASVLLVVLSYCLQDLAHIIYGEETLQANSWGATDIQSVDMISMFFEHVVYLLPLTLDSASSTIQAVCTLLPALLLAWGNLSIDSDSLPGLPFLPAKSRLLQGKFTSPEDMKDLKACRTWCVNKVPNHDKTSHWWMSDLDEPTLKAFERLAMGKCVDDLFRTKFNKEGYVLEPIRGMNELYVSSPCRRDEDVKNSDDVFFTEHVDGPYCFFPFASVFRCIVAMDANVPGYETHFPNAYVDCQAVEGDILGFDFHRESHFISTKPGGAWHPENVEALKQDPTQKWRMVLKMHYAVAPRGLWWCCGKPLHWLSIKYNEAFRALFLATITPQSKFEKFVADLGVNRSTVAYNAVEKYVGFGNVCFYAVLSLLASVTSYDVFLYSTQYLHCLRYICTYYVRKGVAFGAFKRDVLLFKSIALAQLFALYTLPLWKDTTYKLVSCFRPDSIVLIIAGYFVSLCATAALGIDGTYFGIELGTVKANYKFVNKFPYNVLPHPMILGQVVALLGLHIVPQVGGVRPYLIPIHVVLYLIHMTQEIYDVHDGIPWYKHKEIFKIA